jgi:hypothetical protein
LNRSSSSILVALTTSLMGIGTMACTSPSGTAAPAEPTPTAADAGAAAAGDDGGDLAPPALGDVSSATVCLATGTIHDPNATGCGWNSDCKQSPYTDNADWDHGRWKKQCDAYSYMMGVSVEPSAHNATSYLCAMRPDLGTSVGNWQNHGFDSTVRSSSSDWDPGYYKAECPINEYMSGYSVNTSGGGTGSIGNIRCVQATNEGNNTSCHGVTFGMYTADNRESTASGDWASGSWKLECAPGEHIAGMSATGSSGGRIHGILCCNGDPPAATTSTGAGACCNATTFPTSVTNCVANPTGNAAACNLVDYCCQTGVSSYAGTTACAEVSAAQDPNTEGNTGIGVGPGSSSAPSAANGTWTLLAEKSNVRGMYNFGAGYDAITSMSATKATLQATGKGELKGYAILFGKKVTLADVQAAGQLSNQSVSADINVIGIDLWSYSAAGVPLWSASKDASYTFINQSKTFTVGPVPVTVAGSVTGTLGLAGSIGFQGHTLTASAGPYLDVSATASAALGGGFGPFKLEAGVEGSLILFDAAITNAATATPGATSVAYSATSNMALTEISGSIDLFVTGTLNLVFAKYHKKWTYGIVSFTAAQQNVPFLNYNGTMPY